MQSERGPGRPASNEVPVSYQIEPGDTLSGIAARFGTSVDALVSANGIANPNLIYAGADLVIPGWDGQDGYDPAPAPPPDPAPAPDPGSGGGRFYSVQPGDTLSGIAARFGTDWPTLARVNGIANPNLIFPGQNVFIPGEGGDPAPVDPGPGTDPTPGPTPPAGGLGNEPNAVIGFDALWPVIQQYAAQYGADPRMMAAIVDQESGFKNYLVHFDGTGHGLVGLDDNGLLPDFERWSGLSVGRGANAASIPPELQMEYLAKTLASLTAKYGDSLTAAREWHTGAGGVWSGEGNLYASLMLQHERELFG